MYVLSDICILHIKYLYLDTFVTLVMTAEIKFLLLSLVTHVFSIVLITFYLMLSMVLTRICIYYANPWF